MVLILQLPNFCKQRKLCKQRTFNYIMFQAFNVLVQRYNTEEHPTHNHQVLIVIFPQKEYQCRIEDRKYCPAVLISLLLRNTIKYQSILSVLLTAAYSFL